MAKTITVTVKKIDEITLPATKSMRIDTADIMWFYTVNTNDSRVYLKDADHMTGMTIIQIDETQANTVTAVNAVNSKIIDVTVKTMNEITLPATRTVSLSIDYLKRFEAEGASDSQLYIQNFRMGTEVWVVDEAPATIDTAISAL